MAKEYKRIPIIISTILRPSDTDITFSDYA